MTPERRDRGGRGTDSAPSRTRHCRLAAVGLAVIGSSPSSTGGHRSRRAEPAGTSCVHSIVVLPFLDMSARTDQRYLADGVAEEILNRPSQYRQPEGDGADIGLRHFATWPSTCPEIAAAPGCRLRSRGQRAQVRRARAHHGAAHRRADQRPCLVARPTTARSMTCSTSRTRSQRPWRKPCRLTLGGDAARPQPLPNVAGL